MGKWIERACIWTWIGIGLGCWNFWDCGLLGLSLDLGLDLDMDHSADGILHGVLHQRFF